MTTEYQFLLPQPDPETQPYWDAAKNHELRVPKCSDCGLLRWPPQLTCPGCYGENFEWAKMSGRGTLYPNPPKDTDGRREESGRGG